MLSLLDKGQVAVIAGKVTGSAGTDAVLTTAGPDGAATLTATGSGVQTINFGATFLSAPYVHANIVDATFSTAAVHQVVIQAVTTALVTFHTHTVTTNGTATDILNAAADLDFHFMVVGARNR